MQSLKKEMKTCVRRFTFFNVYNPNFISKFKSSFVCNIVTLLLFLTNI